MRGEGLALPWLRVQATRWSTVLLLLLDEGLISDENHFANTVGLELVKDLDNALFL